MYGLNTSVNCPITICGGKALAKHILNTFERSKLYHQDQINNYFTVYNNYFSLHSEIKSLFSTAKV